MQSTKSSQENSLQENIYAEDQAPIKTYVLRCKSCGGTMDPGDGEILICPYCGSKERIERIEKRSSAPRKNTKSSRTRGKRVILIVAVILVILFASCTAIVAIYSNTTRSHTAHQTTIDWDSLELSDVLPKPAAETGYVYTNSSDRLSCEISPYTAAQFKAYTEACRQAGFTVDAEVPYDSSFTAYNEEGYRVDLYHYSSSDYMSIYLDAPIEMSDFIWPTHGLPKLLPAPPSSVGKISGDSNDYFTAYIGEMTKSDYTNYINAVMEAGFDVDYYRSDTTFSGKNADDVRVSIDYEGNKTMSIRISDYK